MSKELLITPRTKALRESMGMLDPRLVAERLGTPLHKGQAEIASYFTKEKLPHWQYATWLISRRWGKSFLGQVIATTLMLTPYSEIFVVAHSTSLADVWWKNVLTGLLSMPELEGKVVSQKKEGIIEIPELNTRFICASYLNAQSRGIGKSNSTIILDEAFLFPPSDMEELLNLLTPTMANYGSNELGITYGKILVLSTPRGTPTGSIAGVNYLKGVDGKKGHISFKYDIYDSPFLSEQEIENIKNSTPKDIFAQEYLVEFTKTSKTILRNFDKQTHVISIPKTKLKIMAQDCDLVIALDFGIVDGNGATIMLYNNRNETYYIIDEHYKKGQIAYDFVKEMKDKMTGWAEFFEIPFEQVIWFRDPANLEQGMMANKTFNLTLHKAKNKRTEGIDYVNQLLQGNGEEQIPKLYVLDTCPIHIQMFEYAEFKVVSGVVTNQFAKDPSELDSHYECLQTTIYATYTHFKTSHNTIIIT